ncbi:MAG TPA: DegQ family serine endoprotease [Candidatus Marinimicrobia bacterium]|nr:DegQ family serine endoprotease [Candidatus Neomarinimicrobiota bacterium]
MKISRNIIIFVLSFSALAMGSTLRSLSEEFTKIAEIVSPAVVTITAEKVSKSRSMLPGWDEELFRFHPFFSPDREIRQQVLGSGVIVDKGIIITNNHVVENAENIRIHLMDRRELKAEIVGRDPKSDIAVLRVKEKDLQMIKMANSDKLRVGEWVLAIGSPFSGNLNHTVTHGIVSALGRSNVRLNEYENFIQTDAAINPGNSGGALVNLDGELVGINSAIATRSGGSQGVGFAIPVNLAKRVMEDLLTDGRVIRAWLGVAIQELDYDLAKSMGLKNVAGALVGNVVDKSPADKAGIKIQDVITAVDRQEIKTASELRILISSRRPGEKVNLELWRNGKARNLTVTLEELPGDEKLAESGSVQSSSPGIRVENNSRELADRFRLKSSDGVIITFVEPNSEADRKGLRPGDKILRIGNSEIASLKDYNKEIKELKSGDTVMFLIDRKGNNQFFALTIE